MLHFTREDDYNTKNKQEILNHALIIDYLNSYNTMKI